MGGFIVRTQKSEGSSTPFTLKTLLSMCPEGNFLVPKLCRFKNIVPFQKIGPIGRARQALKNGQSKAKFAASEIYCRFGL